ncbi:glucose-6-phosphate dehydrogenase [Bacillus sp. MUM 13]|uniref:glucose-6-phosphate dehydrogenase n=1 Tax=Bacillus sp. MUM 13 TaxID=1678001 RepID=UPI0008F572B9|nr:glucose-6-phosphate dehydrogenase [Bacillus sp. MUM 13]OIK08584.1 glucose-6-phosphate dehydrogenase [Bacillus sp. MUM 13]
MDTMTFVLFGGTGDLAKRKIYPALYNLFMENKMPDVFSVVGLGRSTMSHTEFQQYVEESINTFSRSKNNDSAKMEKFLSAFAYTTLNATDKEDFTKLLELVEKREQELQISQNRMFYLSVAPKFFDIIAGNIKESGLGSVSGWKRLIIEKPFGHDLESARELNAKLSQSFDEDEVYRIDHYLGKPMVQNLEALEFANPVLQALWNNQYIANVQITAAEIVGVEERAGYYDQSGAIRDMFQNHMLQMLMMTAMHLPKRISATDIRDEKRKVLESLRPLTEEDVASQVIRGQYAEGEINGKEVVGYKSEPGIEETSQNDTFIGARLWIDDEFWAGVPFYIRTGKRMKEKSTRIVVEFKNPLKELYGKGSEETAPNLLVVEINPNEGVSLLLNSKNPGNGGKIEPIKIDYVTDNHDVPEAYELLIHDALRGDSTFFAHWNEVELSWKYVQPILNAFEKNLVPLQSYKSGSYGPDAVHNLLKEDGFKWWLDGEGTIKGNELTLQK